MVVNEHRTIFLNILNHTVDISKLSYKIFCIKQVKLLFISPVGLINIPVRRRRAHETRSMGLAVFTCFRTSRQASETGRLLRRTCHQGKCLLRKRDLTIRKARSIQFQRLFINCYIKQESNLLYMAPTF
jgi:hypothetical protein